MLPDKESYKVGSHVPENERVYDYLILYLQTQHAVPDLDGLFNNLREQTNYQRIGIREPLFDIHLRSLQSIDIVQSTLFGAIVQNLDPNFKEPIPTVFHFNLMNLLEANGVSVEEMNEYTSNQTDHQDPKKAQYYQAIHSLITNLEIDTNNLNWRFQEYRQRLMGLVHKQTQSRLVMQDEMHGREYYLYCKFHDVYQRMINNFRKTVIHLTKMHSGNQRKRFFLTDKAREILSCWFENHLSDPYPSEEEKKELAASCGITVLQVNYWFGNKRNRYKKRYGLGKHKKPERVSSL